MPKEKEDTTIININTPNSRAPKYMKQKLIESKGEYILVQ